LYELCHFYNLSSLCNRNIENVFIFQALLMIPASPPPSFRNPHVWSVGFIDFVSKCLVKNPDERASAVELLDVSFYFIKAA
jgi:serine/threonine protein kinase